MVELLNKLNGKNRRGFTLIEMLVVIAVIAILAGIIIGVLPAARNKAIRSAVTTDMKAVEMAIDNYKEKHNFYPPDNTKEPSRNALYYELTGTTNSNAGGTLEYYSLATHEILKQNEVQGLFSIPGFSNTGAAEDESAVANFYRGKTPRYREMPSPGSGLPTYKALVAPRYGKDKELAVWNYVKTNPTNNVGEYDLWAEIDIGGDKVIISNWEH